MTLYTPCDRALLVGSASSAAHCWGSVGKVWAESGGGDCPGGVAGGGAADGARALPKEKAPAVASPQMNKIATTSRAPKRSLLSVSMALMLAVPLAGHAEAPPSPEVPT
ncbi:hypothetical protein G6F65_014323 [Rhizopus arrhizus]|nr:hypothetical protein G6F65_014323 [Rhizopus arrhizus]